jgi:hypothetical protein
MSKVPSILPQVSLSRTSRFWSPKIQLKATGTPFGVGVVLIVGPRFQFAALVVPFSW